MEQVHPISFKGVIIGAVFDIVVSGLLGGVFLIAVWHTFHGELSGSPVEQIKSLSAEPAVYWTAFIIGCVVSVVAGYISASIAGQAELLNGALSSFLCVALTALDSHGSTWNLLMIAASPCFGLIGGYLCQQRRSLQARSVGRG